jgi:hypothetical protein
MGVWGREPRVIICWKNPDFSGIILKRNLHEKA